MKETQAAPTATVVICRGEGHRSAAERLEDVLLHGHRDDDRDVERGPVVHAFLALRLEPAAPVSVEARRDQQEHRDPDAADVGLDAEGATEELAEQDSKKMADGEQGGSVERHGVSGVGQGIIKGREGRRHGGKGE